MKEAKRKSGAESGGGERRKMRRRSEGRGKNSNPRRMRRGAG